MEDVRTFISRKTHDIKSEIEIPELKPFVRALMMIGKRSLVCLRPLSSTQVVWPLGLPQIREL